MCAPVLDPTDPALDDIPRIQPTQPVDSDFDCFIAKGFHFIHVNSRSLLPKLDELQVITLRCHPAVIGVTETWLNDSVSDSEVSIPGYQIQRHDRCRTGSGVCVYVHSCLIFSPWSIQDTSETNWIELYLPKTKFILIRVCYRPPTDSHFYSLLEDTCGKCLNFSESECIILGDFNTDYYYIHSNSNQLCVQLKQFMSMFDLHQLICSPTRVMNTSSTILDLIMVSDPHKISQYGVIENGFSEYMLIYCTHKIKKTF